MTEAWEAFVDEVLVPKYGITQPIELSDIEDSTALILWAFESRKHFEDSVEAQVNIQFDWIQHLKLWGKTEREKAVLKAVWGIKTGADPEMLLRLVASVAYMDGVNDTIERKP